MLYYLDTSALIRLLLADHPSHTALVAYFDENDVWNQLISSDLLRIEAMRVAIRDEDSELQHAAATLLENMLLLDISRDVCDFAARIPVHVRSLDAIHIATVLQQQVEAVITYDLTMSAVLTKQYGLACIAP